MADSGMHRRAAFVLACACVALGSGCDVVDPYRPPIVNPPTDTVIATLTATPPNISMSWPSAGVSVQVVAKNAAGEMVQSGATSWKSSDPTIARVEQTSGFEGPSPMRTSFVTGVGFGEATVTATVKGMSVDRRALRARTALTAERFALEQP